MTLALTGSGLTIDDVVRVARGGEPVSLDRAALDRMAAARAVVERTLAEGIEAYGVTTGVGVRKSFRVTADGHEALLLRQHLIAQGPALPRDVVRAAALRLANALAQGLSAARPELAERVVRALNDDDLPPVRSLGSIGQADLAQTADLAVGLLGDEAPAPGEGIALLNQNAFSTGHAALAVHDARELLATLDVAAALDLEALGANREALLHPALASVRPSPGLEETLDRLRALLEGSGVSARSLQDPLSFRTIPQLHGAARDALAFVVEQVERELNAHQSNPLVVVDEGRLVSVGNFDVAALATALDLARLVVAQVLTSAAERSVKLLQAPLTGLPEGLGEYPGLAESALSELGIAVQAIAAEARLLAQPVSLELVSTTQAEAIEDRTTMAPLAARRLSEQVSLGRRVLSIELLLSTQACDLRAEPLAPGAARAHAIVRERAPFVGAGHPLPDLEPLVELVAEGGLLA
jgi:histidine ammonia-lyase